MKIVFEKMFWCNVALITLAAMFGNVGMAVAIGANGSDTDPNNGTPLDNATPDSPNKGIDQQGQGATGSAVNQAELDEKVVDDYVLQFKSYQFPLHTDFMALAQQIQVNTKEPEHYNIGESIMDCAIKSGAGYTEDTSSETANIFSNLYANDRKLFVESATVIVEGVAGYAEDGTTAEGELVLWVESVTGNSITVRALNGPISSGVQYVPTLAAGTKLHIAAPALSESEVEVTPDSFYPVKETAYLQKKVCPIVWTNFFERINKKAKWNTQDLIDTQLYNFRKKCTRSLLKGAGKKWMKFGNKKTGTEYVYSQNGIIRQLRLGYQLAGDLTFADLIGITRMLFSKWATVNEMNVYCGTKFLEKLLNIDFTKHHDITFTKSQSIGVDITSFHSSFGTLNFVKEQALDDLGMEECAIAFSIKEAKRYIYEAGKTIEIDGNKGEGGEVREMKARYYIQDDCLMLTGFNSMLIAPNLANAGYGNAEAPVTAVDSFPNNPSTGDIVYLRTKVGNNGVGLYEYNGSSWDSANGDVINV